MVSLESTAKKLTKQKQETSKIRRYSEREFQKAKSLYKNNYKYGTRRYYRL